MAEPCDGIVTDLSDLLDGRPLQIQPVDVHCEAAVGFVPKTKSNICYIVGAVLFNDNGEVLMIQEAKDSCRGTWYLPMGRLERGETLVEGAIREVLEETGLHFTPTTLLSVGLAGGSWYRFLFSGNITGGKLKTLAEKDEESLQAAWIKYDEIMQESKRTVRIRASDVFQPIKLGYKHHKLSTVERFPAYLPAVLPHSQLLIRWILVLTPTTGNPQLLVNQNGKEHFPTSVISVRDYSLQFGLHRFFKAAFTTSPERPDISGILAVEYSGKTPNKKYGVCLTIVCSIKPQPLQLLPDTGFLWKTLPDGEISSELKRRIEYSLMIPVLSA